MGNTKKSRDQYITPCKEDKAWTKEQFEQWQKKSKENIKKLVKAYYIKKLQRVPEKIEMDWVIVE